MKTHFVLFLLQEQKENKSQAAEAVEQDELFHTSVLFNTFLVWIVAVAYLKYGRNRTPQQPWFTPQQPGSNPYIHSLTFQQAVLQLFNSHIVKNSYRNRQATRSKKREQLSAKVKTYKQHIFLEQERKRRAGPSNVSATTAAAASASVTRLPSAGRVAQQQQMQQQQQPQTSEPLATVTLDDTMFDSLLQDDSVIVDLPSSPDLWVCVAVIVLFVPPFLLWFFCSEYCKLTTQNYSPSSELKVTKLTKMLRFLPQRSQESTH